MPPRTANSPRRSTRSTREYAAPTRPATTSSRSADAPTASSTGVRSPSPFTWGCSSERTGATTTDSGPVPASVTRVAQPPQHGQPPADRVAARAEPLVRQRLPARVVADGGGVDQVAELADQLLGLPGRGGDRKHRSAGARQAGDEERAQRLGTGQLVGGEPAVGRVGHRGGEGRVGEDDVGEAGEGHGVPVYVGKIFGPSTRRGLRLGCDGRHRRQRHEQDRIERRREAR